MWNFQNKNSLHGRHLGLTLSITWTETGQSAPKKKFFLMAHHSTSYAHRRHRDSTLTIHHEGMKLEKNIKPTAVRSGDDG